MHQCVTFFNALKRWRLFASVLVLILLPSSAFAHFRALLQPLPGGGQSWSLPVQTLIFITALGFIPAVLLMMTSFTRIIIVLDYYARFRYTFAPPNQVVLGLALFMTFSLWHRF